MPRGLQTFFLRQELFGSNLSRLSYEVEQRNKTSIMNDLDQRRYEIFTLCFKGSGLTRIMREDENVGRPSTITSVYPGYTIIGVVYAKFRWLSYECSL